MDRRGFLSMFGASPLIVTGAAIEDKTKPKECEHIWVMARVSYSVLSDCCSKCGAWKKDIDATPK